MPDKPEQWKEEFWKFLNDQLIEFSKANPVVNYVENIIQPLQSELSAKDQRIEELEREVEKLKK